MKTFIKRLFILLILCCFFSSSLFKIEKQCKAIINCDDIIFEPWNAIEVQGYSNVSVPYLAGLVSQNNNYATFKNIDIYKLEEDGTKTFITYKTVNKSISTTYNDNYLDYDSIQKQIQYAEPYAVLDPETNEYYRSYNETLKEAIGYAKGFNPSTDIYDNNIPIFEKCFFSLPCDINTDGSHVYLDLSTIFTNMSYGKQYVLLFDGVFEYPNLTQIHLERTVTFHYTPPIAWRDPTIQSIIPDIAKWKKGDGHVHSLYSDGHKYIYDYVGQPENDYERPDPPDETRQHCQLMFFDNCLNSVIPSETIAYKAYYKGKLDWIIMADHANYLFDPRQTGGGGSFLLFTKKTYPCKRVNPGMKPGNPQWFKNYIWECRSAETEIPIGVIPMEEIAIKKICRESDKDCIKQESGDGGGHMLNYNLQNGPSPYNRKSGRIADNIWGGGGSQEIDDVCQIIRDEINLECDCPPKGEKQSRNCDEDVKQPDGVNGWGVIAHPKGSWKGYYSWQCFPKPYKQNWLYPFGSSRSGDLKHKCPSVARSIIGNTNKGKGFFALEVGPKTVNLWDQYLFSDTQQGIVENGKFNEDSNSSAMKFEPYFFNGNYQNEYIHYAPGDLGSYSYGNNFVVGVNNSDDHSTFWNYQEDLTAESCLRDFIPISYYNKRKIKGFDDGEYLMAETNYVPFLDSCTYVYYDQPIYPAYNHRAFLKALRSCGYSNKGVTASVGGGWATFQVESSSGSAVSSGGRLEFNPQDTNLKVKVSALSPYLDDEYAPIYKIIIYACCGDASHSPKIPCGIEGPYEDNTWKAIEAIEPINMTGYSLNEQTVATISKEKFAYYDYIRVEVQFKKSKLFEDIISTAYCNPVLIFNPAAKIK